MRRYLGMSQDDKAALKDTEVGRIDAAIACSNMRQVLSRELAVTSLIRSRPRTQQGQQVTWSSPTVSLAHKRLRQHFVSPWSCVAATWGGRWSTSGHQNRNLSHCKLRGYYKMLQAFWATHMTHIHIYSHNFTHILIFRASSAELLMTEQCDTMSSWRSSDAIHVDKSKASCHRLIFSAAAMAALLVNKCSSIPTSFTSHQDSAERQRTWTKEKEGTRKCIQTYIYIYYDHIWNTRNADSDSEENEEQEK